MILVVSEQLGLGSDRRPHRRSVVARAGDVAVLPADRELPPSSGSSGFWQTFGIDPSRHGWSGWLPTEKAAPEEAIADDQVRERHRAVGQQRA